MSSKNNNIQTRILFDGEAEDISAPTVFTGQILRGTVNISHHRAQQPIFNVVQVVLKGISTHNASLGLLHVNKHPLGKTKNVITQADSLCWEIEKPVSACQN